MISLEDYDARMLAARDEEGNVVQFIYAPNSAVRAGLLQMQEEARLYRVEGLKKAAGVVPDKSVGELKHIRVLAQDLVFTLDHLGGVPAQVAGCDALRELKRALRNYGNDGDPIPDERDNLDRVNAECAAEQVPTAEGCVVELEAISGALQSAYIAGASWSRRYVCDDYGQLQKAAADYASKVTSPAATDTPKETTVEDAPVKMLLDLLLSEQMPPQRFVEEVYRRAAAEGTSFVVLRL